MVAPTFNITPQGQQTFRNVNACILPVNEPNHQERLAPDITLGQWLDEWITRYPETDTPEGRCRRDYERMNRDYIKPQLGSIFLNQLKIYHIRKFVNWLSQVISAKTGKPLSQTSRSHIRQCLNTAMNAAVAEERCDNNPVEHVHVPLPKNSNIEDPYNTEELEILFAAKLIPDYAFIVTMATTAARPGELLAVQWKHLDLKSMVLKIERSLETRSHGYKDTKTHKPRLISLFSFTCEVLSEHRQKSEYTKPNDLIFCNDKGGPLNESVISHRFVESVIQLGLRRTRLYDLRHAHITKLLNDGIAPKIVQKRAGHASAVMTLDRYDHLLQGEQEKAIRELDSKTKLLASNHGSKVRKPLLYPTELQGHEAKSRLC